jgi:tRNA A37 threonylcarbamoyladenosine modification protein TsaB
VWVEDFLAQYSISFDDLEWIGCVVGPGGFTAMRIVTLTLNTIAYVKNIPLFSWSYFDLADISWVREPILIKANRWEYLLRSKQGVSPLFFPIAEIPVGQYFWVGDQKDFENKKIIIQSVLDDEKIASVLSFLAPVSRLHPYYIKKPNITPSC